MSASHPGETAGEPLGPAPTSIAELLLSRLNEMLHEKINWTVCEDLFCQLNHHLGSHNRNLADWRVFVLIMLIKVGRPAHCGWCHSLGRGPWTGQEWRKQVALDLMWPVASGSLYLNCSAMTDSNLELWARPNSSPLAVLARVFYDNFRKQN